MHATSSTACHMEAIIDQTLIPIMNLCVQLLHLTYKDCISVSNQLYIDKEHELEIPPL